MGQDFMPVLAMIMVWGNEYASPNGTDEQLVEKKTRKEISSNVVNAEKRCPDHV
jgi:hypothetical protein